MAAAKVLQSPESLQPFLLLTAQVLRKLYEVTFLQGLQTPLVDVLRQLLDVSCPQLGGTQVKGTLVQAAEQLSNTYSTGPDNIG